MLESVLFFTMLRTTALLFCLQLFLVSLGQTRVSEEDINTCRNLPELDSYDDNVKQLEECWLKLLPDTLSRNGRFLTVTLLSGEKAVFENYDVPEGGCQDPCGPFYSMADYFPKYGYLLLSDAEEFLQGYLLVSLVTGEGVAFLEHPSYISSNFQYLFSPNTETDSGGGNPCAFNNIFNVSKIVEGHSYQPSFTNVFNTYLEGRTIITWVSEGEILIAEYEKDDENCSGEAIGQIRLVRSKEGWEWIEVEN